MLQGIYLEDLLYCNFGMQLGVDLYERINVYRQTRCEKLT
jgi:hypothetical protein